MTDTTRQPFRKLARFSSAIIGFIVVFALTWFFAFVVPTPAARAHELLLQGQRLRINNSSLGDVMKISERFPKPSTRCIGDECQIVVTVDNSRLPRWWRGEVGTFGAAFTTKKGTLVEVEYALALGYGAKRPSVEVRERDHWDEIPAPAYVFKHLNKDGEPVMATVYLTATAQTQGKNPYYDFNFACLSRFRGCQNVNALLPSIDWKP